MLYYKTVKTVAIALAFTLLASLGLHSQNLLASPEYHKARDLQRQAQAAYNEGDYDKAIELSAQAEEYALKAEESAQERALMYRANTRMRYALSRIRYVQQIGAEERVKDVYEPALEHYKTAEAAYKNKEYRKSLDEANKVIDLLADVRPVVAKKDVLPQYYVVRLIPEQRESLWRIAGYDFVYGNSRQWRHLYEANKETFDDPDNPRLIRTGQVLRIPSIEGEEREGMYAPDEDM